MSLVDYPDSGSDSEPQPPKAKARKEEPDKEAKVVTIRTTAMAPTVNEDERSEEAVALDSRRKTATKGAGILDFLPPPKHEPAPLRDAPPQSAAQTRQMEGKTRKVNGKALAAFAVSETPFMAYGGSEDDALTDDIAASSAERGTDDGDHVPEIRADDLRTKMTREEELISRSAAFVPSIAAPATSHVGGMLGRRKHQLGYLAMQAHANEADMAIRRTAARKTKNETQSKFGW